MRDAAITASPCAPWRISTPRRAHGDSIVIAPAVTLSDKNTRLAQRVAFHHRALKIEGGCNCQFALNPDSFEYAVIELTRACRAPPL
jgi:carbamoylphosphate synthase large subunit